MPAPKEQSRAVPAVALLLAWIVPGAGHLYVGRWRTAAFGLVAVAALFALGVHFTEGRAFEFLDPELRGPVSLALTPEIGCLGALLWHHSTYGFGLGPPVGLPSPMPAGIHLGALLTALAGLLNIALCIDAHVVARAAPRAGVRAPALLVAAGWAIPGLGHMLQGRRARAVIVFVLVVGLFAYGTHLAEGANLSRERHFYYWAAQLLAGLPLIVAEAVQGHPDFTRALPSGDTGLLLVSLAGLFNAVLLIDVYGWQEARLLGRNPRERDLPDAGEPSAHTPAHHTAPQPLAAPASTPPPAPPAQPAQPTPRTPPPLIFPGDSPLAPPRP